MLPAGHIITEGDGEAFGAVAIGTACAVIEQVDKEFTVTVGAIEPERKTFVATPILCHPTIDSRILEAMNKAGIRSNIRIDLDQRVGRAKRRQQRRRWRGGARKRNGATRAVKRVEADGDVIRVCAGGQPGFEIVD